jgi:hypothetical protein
MAQGASQHKMQPRSVHTAASYPDFLCLQRRAALAAGAQRRRAARLTLTYTHAHTIVSKQFQKLTMLSGIAEAARQAALEARRRGRTKRRAGRAAAIVSKQFQKLRSSRALPRRPERQLWRRGAAAAPSGAPSVPLPSPLSLAALSCTRARFLSRQQVGEDGALRCHAHHWASQQWSQVVAYLQGVTLADVDVPRSSEMTRISRVWCWGLGVNHVMQSIIKAGDTSLDGDEFRASSEPRARSDKCGALGN